MLPPIGKGARGSGESESAHSALQAQQQMHRQQIRRQLADDARAVSRRGKGGNWDPVGEFWGAPSPKVPRRQAHAEEVFVYVCVCVRVERCARRVETTGSLC